MSNLQQKMERLEKARPSKHERTIENDDFHRFLEELPGTKVHLTGDYADPYVPGEGDPGFGEPLRPKVLWPAGTMMVVANAHRGGGLTLFTGTERACDGARNTIRVHISQVELAQG